MLQALLANPSPLFGLVVTPTRELAFQIGDHITSLGAVIQVRCAVIVGGIDQMSQAIQLAKKPHVVVSTPGRLTFHLEQTKGFSLKTVKYLVIDEADKILGFFSFT